MRPLWVRYLFWEGIEYLRQRDQRQRPLGYTLGGGTLGERNAMLVVARTFGVRLDVLGVSYGLSKERVRQIVLKQWRLLRRWRWGRVIDAPLLPSNDPAWWWRRSMVQSWGGLFCGRCRRRIGNRAMYWTHYSDVRCATCGPPAGARRLCSPVHVLP